MLPCLATPVSLFLSLLNFTLYTYYHMCSCYTSSHGFKNNRNLRVLDNLFREFAIIVEIKLLHFKEVFHFLRMQVLFLLHLYCRRTYFYLTHFEHRKR